MREEVITMADDGYIQVGVTAMRDPATGGYLPAVPLYIKATEEARESEQALIDDIGHLFALRFKEYLDGCEKEGTEI